MVFADLFKSSREIEREKARARRKSLRGVESSTDVVKDEIAALKKERDKAWAQAREYLRDGQKAAAQRLLQSVQSRELTMGKLEKKLWVFNQLALKRRSSRTSRAERRCRASPRPPSGRRWAELPRESAKGAAD